MATSGRAQAIVAAVALFVSMGLAAAPLADADRSTTALDLAGKAVDPLHLAAGKPLVLIFVRTDCPISNRYAPTIKASSQKYSEKVTFVLVYPDKTETVASIQKHAKDYGYSLPPLRDSGHNLVKATRVEITPEVAIFNGKGELIYHGRIDNWYKDFGKARPAPTTHEMDDAIQAALNGSPAPQSVGGVGCYISDLR